MLVNVQEGGVFQFFGGRMTSRGQCPRGGACECPRVGAFFKLMTSDGQCPRGGVRLVFHPSKFRPPPPTWLAGYGPGYLQVLISVKQLEISVNELEISVIRITDISNS